MVRLPGWRAASKDDARVAVDDFEVGRCRTSADSRAGAAKLGLDEGIAFLVGWTLWCYASVLPGELGIQVADALGYAIGPSAEWMSATTRLIGAISASLLDVLVVVSIVGLRFSEWTHDGTAILSLIAFRDGGAGPHSWSRVGGTMIVAVAVGVAPRRRGSRRADRNK